MLDLKNMSDEFNLLYAFYFDDSRSRFKFSRFKESPSPELIKDLNEEEREIARTIIYEKMMAFEKSEDKFNLINPFITLAVCDGDKRAVPLIKEIYKTHRAMHGKRFSRSELENMRIIVVGAKSEDEKRRVRENAARFRKDCTNSLRECLDALYSLEQKKIYLFKKFFLFR